MKVKVTWDLNDTEYESYGQAIAKETLGLPTYVDISSLYDDDVVKEDIDKDEVKSFIYESYNFEVKSFKIIVED
jgi:hypothetical protein